MSELTRLERVYPANPGTIWELWTTPAGIEKWWAPDGFEVTVSALELRVGGELRYAMTATAPGMVEFMEGQGMPLTTESVKTFTEIDGPTHLAYRSLIDFVPDHAPYDHMTVVDLARDGDGTRVVMGVEPLHDEVWTQRLLDGRSNELDNLERLLGGG
jgi:uncharacterized protein YndB with AHSA1/START domain